MDESALSMRERQAMDAIYRLRSATAASVREEIPDPPSPSAVRAVLASLARKGLIRKRTRKRQVVWSPAGRGAAKRAMRRLLDTFFDSSLVNAVALHLNDPHAHISSEDLDELERLIEESRRRTRR